MKLKHPLEEEENQMSKKADPTPEVCQLCCHPLTIKNAVNPPCGHTHCSSCFWKWAKKSNKCPFCRGALIARDRKKELEMENLLERRDEIRERIDEMYMESNKREEFLRILQEDIALEEMHLKDLKAIMRENLETLKKIHKWEARIQLWECCPQKALTLWKVEAKEMEKNWRITKIKELRLCLEELDIIVRLKDNPYKFENHIYKQKYTIPCLITLCNHVPHLLRASNLSATSPEPITDAFNLDTLFMEPEEPKAHQLIRLGEQRLFYWAEDKEWYRGTICMRRREDGRYFVRYEDGDENWENLTRMRHKLPTPYPQSPPQQTAVQNNQIHITLSPSTALYPVSGRLNLMSTTTTTRMPSLLRWRPGVLALLEHTSPDMHDTPWSMTDIFDNYRENSHHLISPSISNTE